MKSMWFVIILLGLGASVITTDGLPEQRTRGEIQLEAITRARPKMSGSLDSRPAVRDWIIEQFNQTAPPIVWDPLPPTTGRAAEFDARNPDSTFVRVMPKGAGIDQLASLLFELHNIGGYADFNAIHESAVKGEVSREEYATLMLGVEFEALLKLRVFLEKHVSDLTPKEQQGARAYFRLRYGPETMDELIDQSIEKGVDLRDHYRDLWESDVVPDQGSPGDKPQ